MSSKNTGDPSTNPAPAKQSDKRGELGAGDLDKVVGGMKPIGGGTATKPTGMGRTGDPCEGGQ